MSLQRGRAFADDDETQIDRSIFSDPVLYRQEIGRVFARSWLFLAHESQFHKPGDFHSTYMGTDPVIVVRQKDGSYKVLLNSCRHRGMRVCRYDSGNAKAFTCSYHGWAYATDGSLLSVPDETAAYGEGLDHSAWGLATAPRVETYKGLIFATWDPEIPPLVEYLGDFTYYLDVLVDPDEEGCSVATGVHRWRMQGNWKLAAEQFAGDMYHAASTHLSAFIAEAPHSKGIRPPERGFQAGVDGGHGLGGYAAYPYWQSQGFSPEVEDWMGAFWERAAQRLGRARTTDAVFIHGTCFPNLSLLFNRWHLRVWHPKGPDSMEVHSWSLLPNSAPPAVRRALLLDYQRHFSASGTWEQDDSEQWNYSTNSNDGFITAKLPLHYGMGAGRGPNKGFPEFPGTVDTVYSEINQRGFYRRWSELMAVPHPAEPTTGEAPVTGSAKAVIA
ncbi:aromatic ring-hydroxylating dioxygenase subunit alpha [Streptomyces sp. NPDC090088]|uniref:aromatic ring-hydroxylating oxygenase subunit alpha n=1 Tax=Streptomyces sp. NPDC090088 TaxID=3365944 RepID=UPI00380F3880